MNNLALPTHRFQRLPSALLGLLFAVATAWANPLWQQDFEAFSDGANILPEINILDGEAPIAVRTDRTNQLLAIDGTHTAPWKLVIAFPKQRETFVISWRMKLKQLTAPGNGDIAVFLTGSSTGPYFGIRPALLTGEDAGLSLLSGKASERVSMLPEFQEDKWYTIRLEVSVPEQKWRYTITREGSQKTAEGEADFLMDVSNLATIHILPLDPVRGAGCEIELDDFQIE